MCGLPFVDNTTLMAEYDGDLQRYISALVRVSEWKKFKDYFWESVRRNMTVIGVKKVCCASQHLGNLS